MSDETKDFRYYADKAEEQISTAEKYVEQIYNPRLRDTALTAADIYARLAAAAPEPVPQRIELHEASCPCVTKKDTR